MLQDKGKRKFRNIKKPLLFILTFSLFISFSFIYSQDQVPDPLSTDLVHTEKKVQSQSISAVAMTSLPFVLAIKNLIVDREK